MLDQGVPLGWTVSLVDNPGFGEINKCITQLADASLVTSSAYIYLIQTGCISGEAETAFYKAIQVKDEGVLFCACSYS